MHRLTAPEEAPVATAVQLSCAVHVPLLYARRMDLNYLFLRQQMEHSRAETARHDAARKAHEQMARAYEDQIERKSGGGILFPHEDEGPDEPEVDPPVNARPSPSASS